LLEREEELSRLDAAIAAAARGTHVRDNLDMGETISCRRECR